MVTVIGWIFLTLGGLLLTVTACNSSLFDKVLGPGIRYNYQLLSQLSRQLGMPMGDEEIYIKTQRFSCVVGGVLVTAMGVGSVVAVLHR